MSFDFAEWAIVARKDDTGFGRAAADARKVLGLGLYFVCPSDRIEGRPPEGEDEFWLHPDISKTELGALLSKAKGILFFEAYTTWHRELLTVAKDLGVKTVCIPMWEWFWGHDPMWQLCDLFACPTRFTVGVVKGGFGWNQTEYVPWPLDLSRFQPREVTGPARLFIHNAGLVDHDDRKGTGDTIRAFSKVRRKDIRLLVRMQKPAELPDIDSRIEVRIGNLENAEQLYEVGDVAIQPSKMEGIGFMVIEPLCVGLPVLTVDYPPMNEFVGQPEMLSRPKWFKRKAYATNWNKQSHLRPVRVSELAGKIVWCCENEMGGISRANRKLAEIIFDPAHLRNVWAKCLQKL